jgi:hypothetical protein
MLFLNKTQVNTYPQKYPLYILRLELKIGVAKSLISVAAWERSHAVIKIKSFGLIFNTLFYFTA